MTPTKDMAGRKKFEVGEQPCQTFKGQPGYFAEFITHDCVHKSVKGEHCQKVVSFCENCYRDHHEDGAEACICRVIPKSKGKTKGDIDIN